MKKIAILLLLTCFLMPVAVLAQSDRVRLSSTEEIAIAFYRTANTTPNFRKWIWDRPPYKKTPAANRPRVFEREMTRIQTAWQGFNKRRDFLTLRFPVEIEPREEDGQYRIGMTLKGLEQSHYLSYAFMKEQIAIFPFWMDVLMDSSIDEDFYSELIDMDQKKEQPFILIVFEAQEADATRPEQIDGMQQWVLKGKIQIMSLYSSENGLLWEYTAPVEIN